MGRDKNIEVFKDTESLCKNVQILKEAIRNSISKQQLILENDEFCDVNKNRFADDAKIIVSKKRSFEAAEQQKIHEERLRRILDVSVINGVESIILGAFGCGAFSNSPEAVAKAARKIIADYKKAFRNIEFAVYCSPRDDSNYKTFSKIIKDI